MWAGFITTAVSAPLPVPPMDMMSPSMGITPESAAMAAHSTTTFIPRARAQGVSDKLRRAQGVELPPHCSAHPGEGVASREDLSTARFDLLPVLLSQLLLPRLPESLGVGHDDDVVALEDLHGLDARPSPG